MSRSTWEVGQKLLDRPPRHYAQYDYCPKEVLLSIFIKETDSAAELRYTFIWTYLYLAAYVVSVEITSCKARAPFISGETKIKIFSSLPPSSETMCCEHICFMHIPQTHLFHYGRDFACKARLGTTSLSLSIQKEAPFLWRSNFFSFWLQHMWVKVKEREREKVFFQLPPCRSKNVSMWASGLLAI